MPVPTPAAFLLEDETSASRFGAHLAQLLRSGDCLLLEGPIGAGKSHIARAAIRALCGEETEVPSPTFTLVQVYDGPDCEIWHADLYRLSDPDEVVELGLVEAMETAISLIEWPDRLGPYLPQAPLRLVLAPQGDARLAQLTGLDAARLAALKAQMP
ncbi:tRNA (adenosine(37)-N6)-threonylcarbamoyltransferase complex ATPase subunit type 1 TsaE [Xinfangfangia sp. CPCC 101601]|uniref:tRNA threonylcarbamoyladenosine biosynthesis protein TsaE n=1 Tax=Pseudogemmobacter lacusdianii TaxID=3069608 RepID=A0ABU0VVC6_9RHOB|nr:tRNA (adenosine(37)-N6)-threonylcarbamoyltransferase complex ATPase subunit type 1 TsaE [Xinfangfangia sp. CPCC 101601]MDQ2065200.1 tRNA (adenosine(37)-N6)-threonylcarbamoyltransferase complex ATPase subunit type 1 TsaE [Xinfangfangia sp. CPCC 101601]